MDAALEAGIYVPHLCDHPDLPPGGVCRLCVVEVEGVDGSWPFVLDARRRRAWSSRTQSDEIARLRRLAMELLLVGHPPECGTCQKYLNCELQSLKQYLGVEELACQPAAEAAAGERAQSAVRLRPQQVRALRALRAGLRRPA